MAPPTEPEACLELDIERIVAGGDGLGFVDGEAVFVSATAAGDRVLARPYARRRDFIKADLVEVLSRGPGRREPPCPVADRCGGCTLQHLDYEAQLAVKRGILEESFRRLGRGISLPEPVVVHRSEEWGQRLRAELKVAWVNGRPRIGFLMRRSHEVVAIPGCPVLRPSFAPLFKALTKLVNERAWLFRGLTDVSYLDGDEGALVSLEFSKEPRRRGELFEALRWLTLEAGLAGASVETPDARLLNWGKLEVTVACDGVAFPMRTGTFVQAHRELALALWRRVRELGAARPEVAALDLYGGSGFFALALAPHFERVTSVEASAEGARLGALNLERNRLGNVRAVRAPVATFLTREPGVTAGAFVLVDPPRGGLEPEVRARLCASPPGALLYLSCDPATLARDVSELGAAGLQARFVEIFDFFPQTAHMECLVLLERRPDAGLGPTA